MTSAAIIMVVALLSGFARYEYKTPECEVTIASVRVMRSAELTIDKNCQVTAGGAGMSRAK